MQHYDGNSLRPERNRFYFYFVNYKYIVSKHDSHFGCLYFCSKVTPVKPPHISDH